MPPSSRGWVINLRRWIVCSPLVIRRYASTSTVHPASLPLKIHLRKYQEECIQAVLTHLDKGNKRLGISLATGAGKTVIFTHLIDRIQPRGGVGDKTLILAHRKELVEQAARHCIDTYPNKRVEIEMGSLHASGSADITVASMQSIISGDRISKFNPDLFKLVLVDEAHHIVSRGYMNTLDYFGLSTQRLNSPALVGVSATLSRFDGLELGAAIDHIVYHKDYIDMIGEKWLSDVIFTTVQTKADITRVKKGANGDFQPGELSRVVNTQQINDITFGSWLTKAQGRKSTLIFCVDVEHVIGLTNTFRRNGIDARFVTGNTPKPERSASVDDFKKGLFPVLVNCGVFTEGTDVPNIDCVLLARPTKSRNLLVQMIGRGMRLHPGKKDCHIIDMVASLETGIVSTPTLFGLDPNELVDEASVDDLKSLQERKEEEEVKKQEADRYAKKDGPRIAASVVFTDYDSIFDLLGDTTEERHVWQLSPHSWVCVGPNRYILSSSNGSFLKLETEIDEKSGNEHFVVRETVRLLTSEISNSPFMRPRKIVNALTFEAAIHAADSYAQKKYPRQFISRNQAWRNRPASEGQLMMLNKLRAKDDRLNTDSLTKGKATDMILKLKHGARGRFASLEADKKKRDKAELRLEQEKINKEREVVSVGPINGKASVVL